MAIVDASCCMLRSQRYDVSNGCIVLLSKFNCRNVTIAVEAVQQTIYLDVVRSLGSLGVVSVDVITQSASAIGQSGPEMYLSIRQQVTCFF